MPPPKADGAGAKQRLTTNPGLLVVSPDGRKSLIIQSGSNKRRRVDRGRVGARKGGKRSDALGHPGVDKIGYYEEMENKVNGKVNNSPTLKEAKSMDKPVSDEGYIRGVAYQAITRTIDIRDLSQSLSRVEGVIEDPENPGKPPGIEEEGDERNKAQDLLILDEGTNTYQQLHPGFYDDDETESDPEQLYTSPNPREPPETLQQGPKLQSLTLSIGPALWSPAQPPKLPPTPASISLVDSTPSSSSTFSPSPMPPIIVGSVSLTSVTGPERWKRPLAKRSRFSGPKIYTPLTLHPPSAGLGVVDFTRTLPLQRDEGDQRWGKSMRQVAEEL